MSKKYSESELNYIASRVKHSPTNIMRTLTNVSKALNRSKGGVISTYYARVRPTIGMFSLKGSKTENINIKNDITRKEIAFPGITVKSILNELPKESLINIIVKSLKER